MTALSVSPVRSPRRSLTAHEQAKKLRLESVVRRGLRVFMEVGEALSEIRDDRLYRDEFASFNEYLSEQWNLHASSAFRVMAASDVARALPDDLPKPTAESQVRLLTGLPEGERGEVWRDAVERSDGDVPTAATVAEVVKERAAPPDPVAKAKAAGIVPGNAEVEVVHPEPAGEPEAEEPAEQTDAEWLASLPAREKLAPAVRDRFDAEALAYRALDDAREEFHRKARLVTVPLLRELHGRPGPWLGRHNNYLKLDHPEHWAACSDCSGQGVHPVLRETCPTCRGEAYHVR